jgi:opacity protein-like surface antigen
MNHPKLLLAAALSAATWCAASQAQTVVYDAGYVGAPYTVHEYRDYNGNWRARYEPVVVGANVGYTVSQYRDYNGNWRTRTEPVAVIGTPRTYVYPETVVEPSVTYSAPSVDLYVDPTLDPRY